MICWRLRIWNDKSLLPTPLWETLYVQETFLELLQCFYFRWLKMDFRSASLPSTPTFNSRIYSQNIIQPICWRHMDPWAFGDLTILMILITKLYNLYDMIEVNIYSWNCVLISIIKCTIYHVDQVYLYVFINVYTHISISIKYISIYILR